MNREDIASMAREAGMHRHQHNLMSNPVQHRFSYDGYEENLERFAAIVASAEREACAKVCDDLWEDDGTAYECAEAIRARGQA
tara:strand:+ start:76 stop:324 length:249 start_codon:yes stop_codon:yes gene_type:complete